MPLDSSRHRSRSDRGQASSSSNRNTTNRSSNAINTSKDSKSSSNARSRSKPGSREDNKDNLKGKSYESTTRASASIKKEIEVSSTSSTRGSSITNSRLKPQRKEKEKTVNELLMKDEDIRISSNTSIHETEKHHSGTTSRISSRKKEENEKSDKRKETREEREKRKKREKERSDEYEKSERRKETREEREQRKEREREEKKNKEKEIRQKSPREKTFLKEDRATTENYPTHDPAANDPYDDNNKPTTAIRRSSMSTTKQVNPISGSAKSTSSGDEPIEAAQKDVEVDYDYDDDFEDYDDDDFEEEDSEDDAEDDLVVVAGETYSVYDEDADEEEEDSKNDSGNYERARRQREMEEVKAAMYRENSARPNQSRTTKTLSDHPKQQSKSTKNNIVQDDQENHQQQRVPRKTGSASVGFNFASAKQRQKSKVASSQARKRGDALLTMIRLDYAKYDLFEMPPIPYESLMAGNSNRVQATSQTGEDDLDEEVQTESIPMLDKWTQNPPPPLTSLPDPNDQQAVIQALHGVGGQIEAEQDMNQKTMKAVDSGRLSKFLESASQALITLLEEDEERRYGSSKAAQEQKDVVFSDRVTLLSTEDIACLQNRSITDLAFAPDQPSLLVTSHGLPGALSKRDDLNESFSNDDQDDDCYRSYLTIWNISFPSQPLHVLVTSGSVTKICFSPTKASMVFAGTQDGAVSVWDLREPFACHREVIKMDANDETVHRSPTFTSSDAEENGHESPITGIRPIHSLESSATDFEADTFQLITCEEQGKVIIWTVIDSVRDSDVHLGLAHWGCVRIVSSVQLEVPLDCLSSYDITFGTFADDKDGDTSNRSDFFVATGNGNLYHASALVDHKPSPRFYKPELESTTAIRSLTFCPFGEQFILAGSDDGSVRMHSVTSEKPLITWPGTVNGQPVLKIIWSPSRPCVFYILDSDSRIHLWDLGVGDIYPAHTVQFEEKVNVISINPELGDPKQKQLLALGMDNGRVEVHHLKSDYQTPDSKSCTKELERFLHYVSII